MRYYSLIQLEDGADTLTFPKDVKFKGDVSFDSDVTIDSTPQGRTYIYEFANMDISESAATKTGCVFPVAGEIIRAYAVVTEAIANSTITTGAYSVGIAGADGTAGADVDAFVAATPVVKNAALGTVYPLTLLTTAVAAGKTITATHVQQAIAGNIKIVVEYRLTG